MPRLTPHDLVEAAREAARARGGALSLQDFHRITGVAPCHVYRLFAGGWSELRDAAGIERHPSHNQRYSDERLLAEFDRVAQALGRVPTWADIGREAGISACVLGRRFGGKEGTLRAYRTWVDAGRPPAKHDTPAGAFYRPPADRPPPQAERAPDETSGSDPSAARDWFAELRRRAARDETGEEEPLARNPEGDGAPSPSGTLPPPDRKPAENPLLVDLPLPELLPVFPDDFGQPLLSPADRTNPPVSRSTGCRPVPRPGPPNEHHDAEPAPQPASPPTDDSPRGDSRAASRSDPTSRAAATTSAARPPVAERRDGDVAYGTRDSAAASRREAPSCKPVVYGEPIDFRGLRHAPVNEQGVVYLFGMVACELGFLVEAIHSGFPDCEAKRALDGRRNQWRRVRIEFEFRSRNFRDHGHDPSHCDLIVCWQHNWPGCPLEVLELSRVVAGNTDRPEQ